MTLRNRTVIGALAVLLVALSAISLAPSFSPAAIRATPQPTLAPPPPYVEGVLGHATNASPFGARSAADRALVALLFRGLVRLGPGSTVVGDLASRWETNAKGDRWTFHLRPDLRWQDGEPLTASDVVFTIDALSSADYDGPGSASWRDVTAVAQDPLTVSLTMTTPLGGFLVAATQPIAPAHLLAEVPAAQLSTDPFGRHPVGSGSYRLAVLDTSRAILIAATPGVSTTGADATPNFATPVPTDSLGTPVPTLPSGLPAPYLDTIEFQYFDDVGALRAAWERGDLDAASGLLPEDAEALGGEPGSRLLRYPSATLLAVVLDLRTSRKEFLDPKVRRALLAAIDRGALLDGPLAGLGQPADSLIPPWSPEFDAGASRGIAFDTAAAQAALRAVGWKKTTAGWTPKGASEPLAIEILCPEQDVNPVAYAAANAVALDWQAIGLPVRVIPLPAAELVGEHLRSGEFQAVVVPLVIGLDPDIYPLLASSQTRTGGSNVSGLQDTSLDKLLAAARAPGTAAARLAAYKALQAKLSASQYILPLVFRDEVIVLRDTVQGPVARPIGSPGDRFWDVLTWRLADGR
jgi:peptide/nickel transport system substrate-binding protein